MLCFEFPPLGGGAARVVHGLAKELVAQGHEVSLVTMGYRGLERRETVDGVEVLRVRCLRGSLEMSHPWELASYVASAWPHVLRLSNERAFDLVHAHFLVPDGLLGLALSRAKGLPLVVTAHGSDVPGYNPDRFAALHRLIAPARRAVAREAAQIVCPSEFIELLVLSDVRSARTRCIPNGISADRFHPRDPNDREARILTVTRMFERKGVQHLLRALKGAPLGFGVDVVGDGPYLPALRELASEIDAPVHFHGWLDNQSAELRDLYEGAQIFVFASEAENFPVVLLEAMSAGLAIVTTDSTGCREVVGDAALRVAPGDFAGLRRSLESLCASAALRRELGEAARDRLESYFTWSRVASQYAALYAETLATSR